MSNYIRPKTAGATVFFTVVAYQRRQIFCQNDFLVAFRQAIRQVQKQQPFIIHAWVQLPDHLHCIWEMPHNDGDYGKRWGQIKLFTTRACPQFHMQAMPESNVGCASRTISMHHKNDRSSEQQFEGIWRCAVRSLRLLTRYDIKVTLHVLLEINRLQLLQMLQLKPIPKKM